MSQISLGRKKRNETNCIHWQPRALYLLFVFGLCAFMYWTVERDRKAGFRREGMICSIGPQVGLKPEVATRHIAYTATEPAQHNMCLYRVYVMILPQPHSLHPQFVGSLLVVGSFLPACFHQLKLPLGVISLGVISEFRFSSPEEQAWTV